MSDDVALIFYLFLRISIYYNFLRCLGHTVAEDAAWHMGRNDSNAPTHRLQEVIDLLNKHKRLQKYKVKLFLIIRLS